jgi:hypothetical protein
MHDTDHTRYVTNLGMYVQQSTIRITTAELGKPGLQYICAQPSLIVLSHRIQGDKQLIRFYLETSLSVATMDTSNKQAAAVGPSKPQSGDGDLRQPEKEAGGEGGRWPLVHLEVIQHREGGSRTGHQRSPTRTYLPQ